MSMEYEVFYLTTFISIITVILVLQNTYLFTLIRSSVAAVVYLILQGMFALWAILRLTEIYAPTPEKKSENITFQIILVLLILLLLVYLYLDLAKVLRIPRQIILTVVILISLILITNGKNTLLYYTVPVVVSELLTLMLWYHMRKKEPYSRELSLKSVIQSIGDCILVLDTKQWLMDTNFSFFHPVFAHNKPCTYLDFCNHLLDDKITQEKDSQLVLELADSKEEKEIDFQLKQEVITCTCKAIPLFNTKCERIGTMISFHNITAHRRLLKELEDKKQELIEINDKLKDYILVVSRLEEAKVKREISLSLQTSIGQEIMELLTMLEVVQMKTDKASLQELELAVETCRKIIGRIRSSVAEIEKS